MNVVYVDDVVVNVIVDNAQLQSRMTQAERIAIFGAAAPNAATIAALADLEAIKPGSSVLNVCNAMVAAGSITQARANAIAA